MSGTPGVDGPKMSSGGENKMAAMVVLLHQSRYCNANHDYIIRWKDLVRFCHFFLLLRRGSWALAAAEDRLHRKMSLGKSHSLKTRIYFGDIFIIMERLQYLQMVWFKFGTKWLRVPQYHNSIWFVIMMTFINLNEANNNFWPFLLHKNFKCQSTNLLNTDQGTFWKL